MDTFRRVKNYKTKMINAKEKDLQERERAEASTKNALDPESGGDASESKEKDDD
jgi:hypothetical protein